MNYPRRKVCHFKNILSIFVILFFAESAFSNGWVKSKYDYYFKLSYAHTTGSFISDDSNLGFDQTLETAGLYAEQGLGFLPWTSHFALSYSYKAIERNSTTLNHKHTTGGFTDLSIFHKNQVVSTRIPRTKINLRVALTYGLSLPTSSENLRIGMESERFNEVPSGSEHLISSVDRGKLGFNYELGMTFGYQSYWLNFGHGVNPLADGTFSSYNVSASIGAGLPFQSWFQLSAKRTFTPGDTIGGSSEEVRNSKQTSLTASLGVTVFKGLAIEAEYALMMQSDERQETENTFGFGLSYRKL